MTLNPYFNNYSSSAEQTLRDDLVVESIKMKGVECVYIPRIAGNEDDVFGEDVLSSFANNYPIEMYVKNFDGFSGEGDFLSKFGLQIRDQIIFTVSSTRFVAEITGRTRPLEGDLIVFPLTNTAFEITFVEEEAVFYSHGITNTYDITCELFEYSSERMITGNTIIDSLQSDKAYSVVLTMDSGSGDYTVGETIYQGANLESATMTAKAVEWSLANTELEIVDITGTITDNTDVIGVTSEVTYKYLAEVSVSEDELTMENIFADNLDLEQIADDYIDSDEENPFGEF